MKVQIYTTLESLRENEVDQQPAGLPEQTRRQMTPRSGKMAAIATKGHRVVIRFKLLPSSAPPDYTCPQGVWMRFVQKIKVAKRASRVEFFFIKSI